MKIERTLLAFANLVLLIMACRNVWVFLIKKRMYKSYPLTITYILLILFSSVEFLYNMFMMSNCGSHDCTVKLLMSENDSPAHIKEVHLWMIQFISLVWTIRQ